MASPACIQSMRSPLFETPELNEISKKVAKMHKNGTKVFVVHSSGGARPDIALPVSTPACGSVQKSHELSMRRLPPDEWTTKTLVPFLCIFSTFFEISLSSGVSNRGEKEVKPHWLDTGWACHLYYRGQIQSTLLTCQRYPKQKIFKNERYPL